MIDGIKIQIEILLLVNNKEGREKSQRGTSNVMFLFLVCLSHLTLTNQQFVNVFPTLSLSLSLSLSLLGFVFSTLSLSLSSRLCLLNPLSLCLLGFVALSSRLS
jgi:hypothetical protein